MNWSDIVSGSAYSLKQSQIEEFEKILRCALPGSYREFLLAQNGGTVTVNHELSVTLDGYREGVFLRHLYPLIVPESSQALSVVELWSSWQESKVGIRQALPIGDDEGMGYFFLMLSPKHYGSICYCWKDDLHFDSPGWGADADTIPDYFGLVALDFSKLWNK